MTPQPLPYNAAMNTKQAMAPSAFARAQLINAQRNGVLPTNFNIAQTGHNVLGQFHQLAGAIGGAKTQPNASRAHQLINAAISGLNGGHNVANNPAGAGPSYGAFGAIHPQAAPHQQQPLMSGPGTQSDPSMVNLSPHGRINDPGFSPGGGTLPGKFDIASLFGQGAGGYGHQAGDGAGNDPRSQLLSMLFSHLMGGGGQ